MVDKKVERKRKKKMIVSLREKRKRKDNKWRKKMELGPPNFFSSNWRENGWDKILLCVITHWTLILKQCNIFKIVIL